MERLVFESKPVVMPFGNKVIVPIGITENTTLNEDGVETKNYEAYMVYLVDKPVTRQNIIQSTIDAEFTADEQKYVMVNMTKKSDSLVKRYNDFIESVTKEV